jgi:DNA mismatch endonuclease (patch repair protein)
VDGCFWHCCPEHGQIPRANASYWEPKLARNVERDRELNDALRLDGWTVFRFWEHMPAADAAAVVRQWLAADR